MISYLKAMTKRVAVFSNPKRAGEGVSPVGSKAGEDHLGVDVAKLVAAYGSAR